MNHDLAERLKDAGFPQKWSDGRYFFLKDGTRILFDRVKDGLNENGEAICYPDVLTAIPTLSELIGACGEQFGKLERSNVEIGDMSGKFIALQPRNKMTIPVAHYCDSPEEAVANLWIALSTALKPL